MQSGDHPEALTEARILTNKAKTSCLIHQVPDKAALEGKTFRNDMTGTLFIGSNLMTRMDNKMLTYSTDPSLDNKLPVKIGTELYLLVMEKTGDQIDIEGGILGVGTKLRFEAGKWISLFGSQYRNGGATMGNRGLELLEGTVKRDEGPGDKPPTPEPRAEDNLIRMLETAKTPLQLEGLLATHPDMAGSILPRLEQAILQEIRNSGVGDRFFIREIMPQGGLPGSMTLVQSGKGPLSVQMEFPGDAMPIVNNRSFAFGSYCLHRFKGRVELDVEGDLYTFISGDDKLNRLTFGLVPRVGYVYLRGKGKVVLKDGKEVKFGEWTLDNILHGCRESGSKARLPFLVPAARLEHFGAGFRSKMNLAAHSPDRNFRRTSSQGMAEPGCFKCSAQRRSRSACCLGVNVSSASRSASVRLSQRAIARSARSSDGSFRSSESVVGGHVPILSRRRAGGKVDA